MPPNHLAPLAVAARRKRDRAIQRAHAALRDLERRGETISFQAVARRGGVSRQWLYTQPELRAEIERLRARASQPAGPSRERSSEASRRQRLRTLLDENRRLRDENRDLMHKLALAYGHQREAALEHPATERAS
jgi:hypothetical protein